MSGLVGGLGAGRRSRRGRSARVGVEALEGRLALSAATTLDPAFGTRGVVLGAADDGDGSELSWRPVLASAGGKAVAVGTYQRTVAGEDFPLDVLAARRYNPDGSPDATFGASGRVNVPLPAGYSDVLTPPRDVVVLGDGSLLFAAEVGTSGGLAASVVFKLDPSGGLDGTFGSGGMAVLPAGAGEASSLAVAGGSIIVAGRTNPDFSDATSNYSLTVTRLTSTGQPDPSFHGTGQLVFVPPQAGGGSNFFDERVAVTPTGQILISGLVNPRNTTDDVYGLVARVTDAGELDATFGTGGVRTYAGIAPGDMEVTADGSIYLSGLWSFGSASENASGPFVIRLLADGTVDPTFQAELPTDGNPNYTPDSDFPVEVGADGTVTLAGVYTSPADSAATYATFFVRRLRADGSADDSFGVRGLARFHVRSPLLTDPGNMFSGKLLSGLALAADGSVLVGGTSISDFGSQAVIARLLPVAVRANSGDYDVDGAADPAVQVRGPGILAVRPSGGSKDALQGEPAVNDATALPAPGDYDGDGIVDLAVYVQSTGTIHIYASSVVTSDDPAAGRLVGSFGAAGVGQSIPAPGDYDGDGVTDLAVYMPAYAVLAYRPSTGGPDVLISFGTTGVDQAVPAPGDYDGDGRDDVAAYLPQYGVLAYRPSSGGADVYVSFGQSGNRATIPAPGDYDGDGVTDVAAYLPQYAVFAYRPSASPGRPDVLASFGAVGVGASIPAPGDYDGDGKADLAVYLPQYGVFAYRPSGSPGSGDVLQTFGAPGAGVTAPAASTPYANPPTVSGMALAGPRAEPGILLPITDEDLASIAGKPRTRRG